MGGVKLASLLLFKGSSSVSGLSACIFVLVFTMGCGSGTSVPVVPAPPVPNTNWVLVGNTGMTGNLVILSDGNGTLYASSNDGSGFARSTDHGVTWAPLNNGANSGCHWGMGLNDIGEVVSGSLNNSSVPACSTSDPKEFLRLVGNRNTWTSFRAQLNGFPNFLFPVHFVTAKGNTIASGSGILGYSTDHGTTWHSSPTGPGTTCGEKLGLAVSPDGTASVVPDTVNIACAPYYSTDGGVNWTVYPQGLPSIMPRAGDATSNLLPNGSLFYSWSTVSVANGECYGPQPPPNGTWSTCNAGLVTGQATMGPGVITKINKNVVVSSGSCGPFISSDSGVHWTSIAAGLPTPGTGNCPYSNLWNLTTDPSGFLYLIDNAGPVYKSTTPQ